MDRPVSSTIPVFQTVSCKSGVTGAFPYVHKVCLLWVLSFIASAAVRTGSECLRCRPLRRTLKSQYLTGMYSFSDLQRRLNPLLTQVRLLVQRSGGGTAMFVPGTSLSRRHWETVKLTLAWFRSCASWVVFYLSSCSNLGFCGGWLFLAHADSEL